MADALAGRARVTVLRGEAGVGKSALLGYLSGRVAGWHVARAVGVESEMELAYAGLHQLCAPMLDHLGRLPVPQREALATVFGRSVGAPPDRFLVGLATLTLFAEVAEQHPLACIVDDGHWLDHASAQILGFVARRLLAERIAVVCAARTGIGDNVLAGLPELPIRGLGDSDARALLLANVPGAIDTAVCDQIVKESHGNPLALLELPRTWNVAGLAGGFGLPGGQPVAGRIEQSYVRRLHQRAPVVTSVFSTLGLALGALITSALVQYAPAPTHLTWWALLAVFAVGIVAVLGMAEPGSRRPGILASLRPRIAVPRQARATFAGAVPCFVAGWALGGLYLSLGPSLAARRQVRRTCCGAAW